jgi:hypothetical protein
MTERRTESTGTTAAIVVAALKGLAVLSQIVIVIHQGAAVGPLALWLGLATIPLIALICFGILLWTRRGLPEGLRLLDQVTARPGTRAAFITMFQADAKRAFRRRLNVLPRLGKYTVISGTDEGVTFWTSQYGKPFAAITLPRGQIANIWADREPSQGLLANAHAVWLELSEPSSRFSLNVMTASKRGWPTSTSDLESVAEIAAAMRHKATH